MALIPVAFLRRADLGVGARLLWCLLKSYEGREVPTQDDLATALNTDKRSILRWLSELKAKNLVDTIRCGRRVVYTLKGDSGVTYSAPIGDTSVTNRVVYTIKGDSGVTYSAPIGDTGVTYSAPIGDTGVTYSAPIGDTSVTNRVVYTIKGDTGVTYSAPIGDTSVTNSELPTASGRGKHRTKPRRKKLQDLPVVVVGDSHDERSTSTSTPPNAAAPCSTRLGARLVELRIGAAREFDKLAAAGEIDEAYFLAELERMHREGLRKDAIVNFLRMLPPRPLTTPAPAAAPHDDQAQREAPALEHSSSEDLLEPPALEDRLRECLRPRMHRRWYLYLHGLDVQIAGDVARLCTHSSNTDYRAELASAAELVLRHDLSNDPRLAGIARIEVQ